MRECGNRNGEAVNLSNLASIAYTSGDVATAKGLLEEALSIMREIGDTRSEAAIRRNLEELEAEARAALPDAAATAAAAATPTDILVEFLQADGPLRAVLYGRHAATLQSPEVDALLGKFIASAEQSGDTALAEYGHGIRAFLRDVRNG
jgi:hypothetical protein